MNNIDSYYNSNNIRLDAKLLANKLCDYDVISFDVFDTLILRPFTSPRVLFSIMEQRLGIYKFAKIRVNSEDKVREKKEINDGHDNVTLTEIYNLISKKTNLNPNEAAKLEYDLELNYCFANPYFKEVISILKKKNKKMIVVSDMYLSQEQVQGILKSTSYDFEDFFISSEYKKSKKNGNLFDEIIKKYKNKNIIHIGDNYTSDIVNAEKKGLHTYYYRNINDIASKTRFSDMSYITNRVYSAIINNHLYNGPENYSDSYKLGFIYGGIYILGFVQWINKFTNERNIDKILFLSRDGDVYSKMYDKLPEHKEWEYFHWSRLAGMKITALENFYEFCRRMIWHKARGVYKIKVIHLLDFYEIGHLSNKLQDLGLKKDDIMTRANAQLIEDFFYIHKDEILESFKDDINATIEQVKKSVGNSKRVAIIDVGWAGTGPIIIKKITNHYLNLDTKTYSLLAGFNQPIENMASIYKMDGTVHSYLFSNTSNKDILDSQMNHGTTKNNLLLELFTQSCSPSFLGYKKGGLEFDYDEVENYKTIKEINKGTEDFIDIYLKTFNNDQFLLNVSAYDAYLPFNELKNDVKKLDSILSNLIISRGKFYDAEGKSSETWLSFFLKEK